MSWTLRRRFSVSSSNCFKIGTALIAKDGVRSMSTANVRKENIVIIGGGITGLASAVSLHRLGIGSLVLEQAKSLRTEGIPIAFPKDIWRAIHAIGVGDELKSRFYDIEGVSFYSDNGTEFSQLSRPFKSLELRVVERRVLLEMLASKLPADAISFSSKLTKIETSENGNTLLQLEDGSHIYAEVVIACDGNWSPTAKWMGFREPKYAGKIAFFGTGHFPEGHPYETKTTCIYGREVVVGFLPISKTDVYWHVCYKSSSQGPRITDPSILKQEAKELVQNWPLDVSNMINNTRDDTITRSPCLNGWLWPLINPPASTGRIALVGDAWHPYSPYIKRYRYALEDSVVLTQKLADALKYKKYSVEDAFKAYGSERRHIFREMASNNVEQKLWQWSLT